MADKKGLYLALFEALKGSGSTGTVTDVQVNGTSVVQDGVATVPVASFDTAGVIKTSDADGIGISSGRVFISGATETQVKNSSTANKPLMVVRQHMSVFYGLAKAAGSDEKNSALPVGQYTPAAKSAISTMLTAPESVTGTTPTITALAGVQYVCGECATLDIILPASGCVDVRFESGSTPTVLTITPPSGVTVKWAGGFDPTSLDANTTYEINICDGLGVAVSWT